MVVKVPQIAKIVFSHSADGISFLSYFLETIAASITFGYNYRFGNPFSTYGETFFIILQNLMVLTLLGAIRRQLANYAFLFLLYSIFLVSLVLPDYLGDNTLLSMQAITIPLGMISRLPQIWSIWRRRSTGQLSALTCFALFAGSTARVFTCYQETRHDFILLLSYLMTAMLNATVMVQMLYYWNMRGAVRHGGAPGDGANARKARAGSSNYKMKKN